MQCFDQNGEPPEVTLGDLVTVTGTIGAYNNEVQIVPGDNVTDVTIVDGTPADVPAPMDVALADFNSADKMGWLIRVEGQVRTTEGQHATTTRSICRTASTLCWSTSTIIHD